MIYRKKHKFVVGDRAGVRTMGSFVFWGTIESINDRTARVRIDPYSNGRVVMPEKVMYTPVWLLCET